MADISKIQLPDGSQPLDIKDANAVTDITINGSSTEVSKTGRTVDLTFRQLSVDEAMNMMNESIGRTDDRPLTNDQKPYVMTYIDYTDNNKSYTAGDVNNLVCYNKRRRCNISDNGTLNAFYGDISYKEDGTNGQVMVYQPKFYYKVEPGTLDGVKIRTCRYYISDYPLDGYKIHPAFIDRTDPDNPKEMDYIYIGAYEGCLQNGAAYITDDSSGSVSYKLSSIAYNSAQAMKPASGVSGTFGTIGEFATTASNRGAGWCIENIWIASMNQLMFIVEMCNPDSQTALGPGVTDISDGSYTDKNNSSLIGSTSPIGNYSGKAPATFSNVGGTASYSVEYESNKISVSYRGMENPFGNIWKWVDGITIENISETEHTAYICKSFTYIRTSEVKSSTDYVAVNFTIPGNGYTTAFGYDAIFDWLFISAETNSSDTGTIHDGLYTVNSGYTCAVLGGSWLNSNNAGLFDLAFSPYWGSRLRNGSARLCYLPISS